MKLPLCSREKEVLALLRGGQSPSGFTSELRSHVFACQVCKDLVLVTDSFQAAKTRSTNLVSLHTPGLLWWKAQLRRRQAAVTRVSQPLWGAQMFALGIYVVAAVAVLLSQATHGLHWLEWLAKVPQARAFHLEVLLPASNLDWNWTLLVPSLVLLTLGSGLLLFFTSEKH